MGRKGLTVVVWLISAWNVTCLGIRDNESAESAPRLYRNANGIYASAYASAAPYGAFSFHVPTAVPAANPTQLIPVKQETVVIQNSNGYLKDSYGNKFVETPTSVAYKTAFPQQFVQLQHLPAHLAQPLTAAPSYHFPKGLPQSFFGAQYRLPSLDATTSPFTRYGAFAQPFVYAGNVKSFTPASDQQFHFGTSANTQQGSSNNKEIYATQAYRELQNEPVQKFQRLEQKPQHEEYYEAPRQQAAPSLNAKVQTPITHTVKTTHNGKETVVQIETKPPLPLLDLSLLEPLTFANPVVPQVQHYLPKINALTYSKLHPDDDSEDQNQKEIIIEKTKSYDTGVVKGKAYSDDIKKKQKKPPKKDAEVYINFESKSEKPSIKVKGKPNDPGYSYEINSPGHKESFNQQVVSYNKETQSDPVTYTYEKQTQKEPVTYSYSHSSKDPGQAKVQYVKKDPTPGHLVYHVQPEQGVKHNESPNPAPEESEDDDSNESSEADDESPSYDHAQYDTQPHHDKPHSTSHSPHYQPSHSDKSHSSTHSHQYQPSHSDKPHSSTHSHQYQPSHSDKSHSSTHSKQYQPSHSDKTHSLTSSRQNQPSHSNKSNPSTHSHQSSHGHQSYHGQSSPHSHTSSTPHSSTSSYHPQSTSSQHSHVTPSQHLKAEHRGQINHSPTPSYYVVSHNKPQYYTHSSQTATPKLPTLHEYVENLRFIPSYPSPITNAAIRVDPRQPQSQTPEPQYYIQQTTPRARSEGSLVSQPVIYEKSKKIIIQQESPDEMHSHQEKHTAQMQTVGQDENNEEDFEKSYKEAAYGFPAYDRNSAESEEEIYGHNYGEPRQDSGEDNGSLFEQYAEEGDQFPKSARLGYKDDRDKTQADYFLGFSLSKPEVMTDRHQSKLNYYKMFLKNKPEHLRANDGKKKKSKYTVEPSFYNSAPKQKQQQSAQYRAAPTYEYSYPYDYDKEARDSAAHASRPLRYKSKTHFVEPQFQYGFEPIAIPRIDSEQETMASNVSPKSEKPGTRKKVYKENWYIKKTTTSSKPS